MLGFRRRRGLATQVLNVPSTQAFSVNSLLKNLLNASHPERSAAMGEGGAARSRRIPWNGGRPPKQATIGFGRDVAHESHGILRLRCARLSASAPLRMTPSLVVFQQAVKAETQCKVRWTRRIFKFFHAALTILSTPLRKNPGAHAPGKTYPAVPWKGRGGVLWKVASAF